MHANIRIADDSLIAAAAGPVRAPAVRPAVLDRFAGLAAASDAELAAFAGRHGLLGLCPHGLGRHEWTDVHVDPPRFRWCRRGREPLALWRDLAGAVGAAMALAAELHAGRDGSPAHVLAIAPFLSLWRDLPDREARGRAAVPGYVRPDPPDGAGGLEPRVVLSRFLDAWLATAGVAPSLRWGRLPEVQLVPREPRMALLAGLGIALMGRITRSVRPDFCHACGAPLTRRARRGARSFCKRAACQRAKRNLHQAEYRARAREGR